ncbi:hypothetical protein [Cryobacterium sp. TMT2-42-4]|uniref:hypothetical protein n=1 Tax=Cryobacterium sp. TMT2-42-4 TaxID=1259255 RepID=UPI001069560B|nr:hypothetical protein [Cryobacterium sp. TMT2-42-4]TFC37681.1 hypothetical protein E3O18_05105 [Cryobacterium sp. TMT2-42-4]
MSNVLAPTEHPDPRVRIEANGRGSRGFHVDVRQDTLPRPVEADRANLWCSCDQWGYIELHAVLDGVSALTFWDGPSTQVRQKAHPAVPEHFLAWCRRVHMNLVTSYCQIAEAHLTLQSSENVFEAAAGQRNQASCLIDKYLEVLGEACRWGGVDKLWATGAVADRTDIASTAAVEFILETKDAASIRSAEILRRYFSRVLGRDVSLIWRRHRVDSEPAHITIKKTRELWTAEQ